LSALTLMVGDIRSVEHLVLVVDRDDLTGILLVPVVIIAVFIR